MMRKPMFPESVQNSFTRSASIHNIYGKWYVMESASHHLLHVEAHDNVFDADKTAHYHSRATHNRDIYSGEDAAAAIAAYLTAKATLDKFKAQAERNGYKVDYTTAHDGFTTVTVCRDFER